MQEQKKKEAFAQNDDKEKLKTKAKGLQEK
jgi:hypothetical protein